MTNVSTDLLRTNRIKKAPLFRGGLEIVGNVELLVCSLVYSISIYKKARMLFHFDLE